MEIPGVATTRLATRLQPADARSRGCQHLPAERLNVCSSATRAARTLSGLDAPRPPSIQRRFLPDPPPSSACRAGGHPGRRAACAVPTLASSWTLAFNPGGLLRSRFVSGVPHAHVPWAAVPSTSPAWGRAGAWTAPRSRRLPRPCVGLLGQALLRISPGASRD